MTAKDKAKVLELVREVLGQPNLVVARSTIHHHFTVDQVISLLDLLNREKQIERGAKGGKARAKNLSPERKSEIARQASHARWAKQQGDTDGTAKQTANPP